MTNSERANYIKGMMEGMELDPGAKETRLFRAMVELLEGMGAAIDELEGKLGEVSGQVDEVDHDLACLEEEFYNGLAEAQSHIRDLLDSQDDDDEEEGCGCGGHCHHHHHHEAVFETMCPNCGVDIELTEEMLEGEGVVCPGCGERLEFDFGDDDDDEPEDEEDAGDVDPDDDDMPF